MKTKIIGILLMMLFVGVAILPSINSSSNTNGWWDTNWNYRKKLYITNAESDYQMKITVWREDGHDNVEEGIIDCENHCESDFSDIRFTDNNNKLLPYWIEDKGTGDKDNYAKIWVKTSGDEYIYMYYGNPSASHVSNSDDTFILFDDFNDNELGDMWTIENINGGLNAMTVSEEEGKLKFIIMSSGGAGDWRGKSVTADLSKTGADFSLTGDFIGTIEMSWRSSDKENVRGEFGLYTDAYDYITRVYYRDTSGLNGCNGIDPSEGDITGDKFTGKIWSECSPHNDKELILKREDGTIKIYFDGEFLGLKHETEEIDKVRLIMLSYDYKSSNYVYFDNLVIRKYSSPQPYWERFENEQSLELYYHGDLDSDGGLSWGNVQANSEVTGSFTITNIGESLTELSWKVESYPEWGIWTITPVQGSGLTPENEPLVIEVNVVAPDETKQFFSGEIKIVNNNVPYDYENVQVTLTTPRNILLPNTFFMRLFERFPNAFPLLRQTLF